MVTKVSCVLKQIFNACLLTDKIADSFCLEMAFDLRIGSSFEFFIFRFSISPSSLLFLLLHSVHI
jgi:hypothetical protein